MKTLPISFAIVFCLSVFFIAPKVIASDSYTNITTPSTKGIWSAYSDTCVVSGTYVGDGSCGEFYVWTPNGCSDDYGYYDCFVTHNGREYGILNPYTCAPGDIKTCQDVVVTGPDGKYCNRDWGYARNVRCDNDCDLSTCIGQSCDSGLGILPGKKTCACSSFNYSAWGACDGTNQTRSVISTIPAVCAGGASPVVSQPCSLPCTGFNYGAWSSCAGGVQTRSVTSTIPATCTGGASPVTSQACTDTCTGFNYTPWSACIGSVQTRTVISSIPAVCVGGTVAVTAQACDNGCAASTCQTSNNGMPTTCNNGLVPNQPGTKVANFSDQCIQSPLSCTQADCEKTIPAATVSCARIDSSGCNNDTTCTGSCSVPAMQVCPVCPIKINNWKEAAP